MKQTLYALIALFLVGQSYGQATIDTVTLGAGYANQSFYRLSDGAETQVDKSSYELMFDVSNMFSTSINFNSSASAKLWVYPNGTISDWSSVDTNGIENWNELFDFPDYWSNGAFDQTDGIDPFDVGWGIYNSTTHAITGDSIYILQDANGAYHKLQISDLTNGVYNFKFADIDGSNEVLSSINKSDFAGKNFAFYSVTNAQVATIDPVDGWDLLFGQYIEFVPSPYLVSGILAAPNCEIAEENGVDPVQYSDYSNSHFSDEKNGIGYDWKSFNGSGFEVADDRVYFLRNDEGMVWKLVLMEFSGSSAGQFIFSKEALTTADLGELKEEQLIWYPNPSRDGMIYLKNSTVDAPIQVFNPAGQLLLTSETQTAEVAGISLTDFDNGIYWVQIGNQVQQIHINQ